MVAVITGNGLGLVQSSLNILGGANSQGLGQAGGQAYVNAATGNLILQFQDEALSGTGADLRHLRTYNSQGQFADSDIWRWQGEKRVVLQGTLNTAGSTVTRTTGDGYSAVYTWNGSIYVTTDGSGAHDTLSWNASGSEWVWAGGGTGMVERYHGSTGWIKSLRDSSGNGFDYTFSGNLLTQVRDIGSGQTLKLVYDSNSRLVRLDTSTTAGGTLTQQVYYTYDATGRLSSVVTDLSPEDNSISDGHVYTTTYTYASTSNRVASIVQSDGTQVNFTYDANHRIHTVHDQSGLTTFTYTAGRTDVQNGAGDTASYYYDTAGQLTRVESAPVSGVRQSVEYTYDAAGNVETITDGRGNVTTYEYDSWGNRVLERDSLGNTLTRTFDAGHRVTTETRYAIPSATNPGAPETTRFVYDSAGRLRFSVSAQGQVSETRYNSQGLATQSIQYTAGAYNVSSLGVTTTLTESQLNSWVASQDKTKTQLTEYSYDYRGNLSETRGFAAVNSSGVGIVNSALTVTKYTYSAHGQLLQTIAVRGVNETTLSSVAYDGLGRQIARVDANGTTSTAYNSGQVIVTNSTTGLTVTSAYDSRGRLLSVTSSAGSTSRVTQYAYDNAGRLRMSTDPTGVRSYLFYDAAGRVSHRVDGAGAVTAYSYDADGRILVERQHHNTVSVSSWTSVANLPVSLSVSNNSNDRLLTYTYDQAGRLASTRHSHEATETRQYDGTSRLTQTNKNGMINRYFYDKDGRLIGTFIRGAIASVASAAILGGLLAMVLVLLFLGSLRKSFVVGLSIPIAIMATFALMGIGNLTLNIISLGGLALGVGLLLDNGIVMLENIYRHKEELHQSAEDAAHSGAAEVRGAITAGTLTNLAAVLPFLLISGMASLIFTDLILTISFAILATLAASLTLIPMLAALLGKVRYQSHFDRSRLQKTFNRLIDWLRHCYRALLRIALRWRWGVLALALLSLVLGVHLAGHLGNEFLPQVDDGNVHIRINLPVGSTPEDTDKITRAIEARVRDMPHVDTLFAMVGGHLGGGSINERPGTSNLFVRLGPPSERPDMPAGLWVAQAQRALNHLDLPGVRISVRPPIIRGLRFTTSGDDFAITVVGQELSVLRQIAQELSNRLQHIPGLEGVEVGRESQSPLLRIRVDRERAADLGLNVSQVGEAIRQAVNGAVPTRYISGSVEYDVRVRLPRTEVADAETLGTLLLFRHQGEPVLLRDVAHFELGAGPAHIERENQSRIQRVVGDINTQVADVGSIMATVEERLRGLDLPDQYSLIFGGQWEAIQETHQELLRVIALALFLVFVVLAVQYERLTNPLVILTAAPLSLIGVVVMLWATATPLSAPVMIGVVLLIGIVVNNAILLVEYIEIGRREHQLGIEQAIIEAGGVRLRPILMTTLTTVVGMAPLAIGLGEGAEIMRPLAIAVIGGLLGAMFLTLVVVPCLYLVSSRGAEWLKHKLVG